MVRNYPHLDDTQFPDLNSVDVFKYRNNFDYSRWQANTSIVLCNVKFNSDYKDVVKFDDNTARDTYFNNLQSHKVQLTTAFHVVRETEIKVPIPYDVAARYNYMYIDLPIATSQDQPLDYENSSGVKRWYYFIQEIEQIAPSTTMLYLKMDIWTTFINDVSIPYMMLERGHAPMTQVSLENYLANPIANNEYLLAPDFDFGTGNNIVATSDFIPVGNEDKYVLIATTASTTQISSITEPSAGTSYSAPTFSDTANRWGYQYQVNDYLWETGDYNYNGSVTPNTPMQKTGNSILNGYNVIATAIENASTLFSNIQSKIPYFAKTIKAVFVVSSDMVNLSESTFTFLGVTCRTVNNLINESIESLVLTQNMFGFDNHYRNIVKLYTFPYSYLEVTDNNGIVKKINIENISNLNVRKNVSLAYPFLKAEVFLTGIAGSGYSLYSWRDLTGTERTRRIYNDDFGEYTFNWDIPTYELYVRGYDVYKADAYNNTTVEREAALYAYRNAVGLANTDYENTEDAATTSKTNIDAASNAEYTNAERSADVSRDNATRSANTGYTNAVNSATTDRANAKRSADTSKTNHDNDAATMRTNTTASNSLQSTTTSHNNTLNVNVTNDNNGLLQALQAWDAGYSRAMTDAENSATMATGVSNAVSGVAASIGNGIASGNPLGMIGSLVSGGANAINAGVCTAVTMAKNSTACEAGVRNSQSKVNETSTNNSNVTALQNGTALQNTQNANNTSTAITNNSATTIETNATNTKNTIYTNSNATYTTAETNADNTRDTTIANADDSYTAAEANADNTRDTTQANATREKNTVIANSDYTRDRHVANAQRNLQLAQDKSRIAYRGHYMDAPVGYTSYSGDATLDAFQRRGLQVKVKTQRKSEIAQVGDLFLRFGYALNRVWNVANSGLNLMQHFTYWKASDIWVRDINETNGNVQDVITNIFLKGVTVWKNPTEIGGVSIYDN